MKMDNAAPVKATISTDSFDLKNICVGPFTLVSVDLSAHSYLWDKRQSADRRCETDVDWLISRNASILNNGEPTYVNRATARLITRNITMINNR